METALKIIIIYVDTFYKLWLKLGFFLYKIDRFNEKLFDKLIDKGWLNLAIYLRSYGTTRAETKSDFNIFPIAAGHAEFYTDRSGHKGNNSINRCYFGLSLFGQVFKYHSKKISNWLLQPAFKI
jgi:hypothetical protein